MLQSRRRERIELSWVPASHLWATLGSSARRDRFPRLDAVLGCTWRTHLFAFWLFVSPVGWPPLGPHPDPARPALCPLRGPSQVAVKVKSCVSAAVITRGCGNIRPSIRRRCRLDSFGIFLFYELRGQLQGTRRPTHQEFSLKY